MQCFVNKGEMIMRKKIVIAETGNVMSLPPIISLIQNLLHNGHRVKLVSRGGDKLPDYILSHDNFRYRIKGKGK